MPAVARKMADLNKEILSKIDQKFSELNLESLSELKDQIKKEVSEAFKTVFKKLEELKSTVSLLQEHAKNFQKQVSILECKIEELEQYGRRSCLESVPSVENESSDVLGKIKSLITESGCEIQMWLLTEPIELAEGIKIKLKMFPV